MADKILATFRIDREEWEAFKKAASAEGSSASAVLLEIVRGYGTGKQLDPNTKTAPRTIDLDTNVPSSLDTIEQRLLPRIDEHLDARLTAHLDSVERRLDNILINERIEARIDEVRSQLEDQLEALRGKLKAR